MSIKTLKFRIRDSNNRDRLKSLGRKVNFVWNFCNETSHLAWNRDRKWLSGFDINMLTAGASKSLGLNSKIIQMVGSEHGLRRHQFKKSKLRWRSKKSLGWIPFRKDGIRITKDGFKFAGKVYRVWQPDRLPSQSQVKSGQINEDSLGRWYINIPIEYNSEITRSNLEVGIDLGIKDLANLSDGTKVSNNRYFKMMERKLTKSQRSGDKPRSRRIHAKIKNQRKDFLHKESSKIVNKYERIIVGDLKVAGLKKGKLGKSLSDVSATMFKRMLEYKAIARQCDFKLVNEYNTTLTCSVCKAHSGPRGTKGLSVREWKCCECGSLHDRDTNAAKNILLLGLQELGNKDSA